MWENIIGTTALAGIGIISYLLVVTVVSMFIGFGLTKGYQFASKKSSK